MMRWRADTEAPTMLASAFDLSTFGFFERRSVREFITFFCRTIVQRCAHGMRTSVNHENYVVHVHMRTDGLAGVVVADAEYPERVAFTAINSLLLNFHEMHGQTWPGTTADVALSFPPLDRAIAEFQDPAKADKLSAVQKDLDKTRGHVQKTMEALLDRGTQLDSLVAQSNDLSMQSKMFYENAAKANRCCVVM